MRRSLDRAPHRRDHCARRPRWLDQQQASADKRVGETVLTTAIIARDGDHLSKDPIVLNRAILGLKAVGLDPEARALAVEAALAGGT